MNDSLDRVLEQRLGRSERGRRVASFFVALALHAAAVTGALLGPGLFKEPPRPIEFVAVQLLPAPALGVATPAPPAPQPAPERPRPAETTPVPTPPAPEPEAPPPPERRREPAPPSSPPPSAQEPRPSAPSPPTPQSTAPAAPAETSDPGARPGREGSPTGSPTALTQSASVAGVDNPNFTYGYYLDRMAALIRAQWVRPPLGGGIEAMLHFRISADGRVSDVRIVQSSGYSSFDLAALRAVQSAAPLPPLPRSYRDGSLGVNLIFR